MTQENEINRKLLQIKKVFKVEKLQNINLDKSYIQKYYKVNQWAYSLFHTFSDKMYMGISRDGIYKEDDLLEAARVVQRYIKKLNAKKILELASGRGATSTYLAKIYPDTRFDGIELSPGQIVYAKRKAKKLKNYFPILGDYHNLSNYRNESIDIVFVIEALCYSTKKEKVLSEVKRVLKKNGVFIIFDGYLCSDRSKLNDDQKLASELVEIGMAVSNFEVYQDFLKKVKKLNFKVVEEENVSKYIMPTLRRFEKLAKIFFASPSFARIISRIFPAEFIYNSISGYLLPNLIEENIACYYITIVCK